MEKQLGLLRYIQSVNRAVTITEACDFAVRAIADDNLYANPSVFLLSEDSETLELAAWYGFEPQTRSIPKNTSLSWRSIRKESYHIIDDIASCPDYVSGLPGSCSELNFPISGPEGSLGVFSIESTACGVFSEEDVETVSLLSAVLGSTLAHLITRERLSRSLEREEARNRHRKLILDLDQKLFGSRCVDDAVEYFMNAVQKTFGFDKIYLFLRSGPGRQLRLKSNRGKDVLPESVANVLEQGRGLVGMAIRTNKPVLCNDVTLNPDYFMDDEETLSELAVPVLSGGSLWGVLVMDEYHRDAFAAEDEELARVICNQLAAALEAIRNFEMASRDLALMQTIHDVVVQVASERNIEGMCRRAVDLLREHTLYEIAEIDEVIDEETGLTRIIASSRFNNNKAELEKLSIALQNGGGGMVGKAVRDKQLINSPDVRQCPYYAELTKETVSELDIPIMHNGRVFAALSVESDRKAAYDERDERVLSVLARHLAVLWAHNELLETTEKQALQDPLTGLWNRRCIMETLEKEINRCLRYNCSFCLAVVDLNDFKSVNDRYGHPEGDRVLREFSEFFGENLRGSDLLGRWGGDEFLVILPETPAAESLCLLRRVRSGLETETFGSNGVCVGMDFGIAAFPGEGKTSEELVDAADRKMYEAKKNH